MLARLPHVVRAQRWGRHAKYRDEYERHWTEADEEAVHGEQPEWQRRQAALRMKYGRRGSEDPPDLATLRLAEHVKSIMFFQGCGKVLAKHSNH